MNILDFIDEQMKDLYFSGYKVVTVWDDSADPAREELPRLELDLVDFDDAEFTTQSFKKEVLLLAIYFFVNHQKGLGFRRDMLAFTKDVRKRLYSIYAREDIEDFYALDVGRVSYTNSSNDLISGFILPVEITFDTTIY